MIRLFFKQHLLWLVFLVMLQTVINLILYVDKGFQGVSFFYINLVWLVLIAMFLLWRYLIEVRTMRGYAVEGESYAEAVKLDYEERLTRNKVELQEQRLLLLERQDELLAWVHEMKSPMTAMQLLVERMEDMEVKERFETEWLRLYLLLDQQLHATRLLTIEQDNRIERVALKAVLVEEIKELRSWCFEKQIAIELEDVELEVLTDRKWLAFIVRQMFSNAVKYSHIGGEVQLSTVSNNGQLALLIQDNGVGIKQEDLPRVFRKSYTGTIGRETSAATGMGLYLAKQAADSLRLKIVIESTESIGTTVKILFPKDNMYNETLLT
ncbi:sensor histidine kinase [Solibacillus sp. MA9]|uniref:histidine kinase n=1 Tax=Solibacillus palustris TaxID=2908203 RepID=A0ABS9UGU5_9BACL|nr:sensor histidine kinase [Solibacillus sp. MA9]MCH7323576.1 sensor histidine kinase [Solibacillus sp. MA9]